MKAPDYKGYLNNPFKPRTPNASLRAAQMGLSTPEYYAYKASSVSPLHEVNISLDELDRILGQPDRNLDTNLFLTNIFEKLLDHKDPEVALFAAESISLIENSYNVKIEDYKKKLEKKTTENGLLRVSELYYELALLNESKQAIKNFYLKESFSFIRKLEKIRPLKKIENKKMFRLLMELKLNYQAKEISRKYNGDPEMIILEAEAEYSAGNYQKVASLCKSMESMKVFMDLEEIKILNFWTNNE